MPMTPCPLWSVMHICAPGCRRSPLSSSRGAGGSGGEVDRGPVAPATQARCRGEGRARRCARCAAPAPPPGQDRDGPKACAAPPSASVSSEVNMVRPATSASSRDPACDTTPRVSACDYPWTRRCSLHLKSASPSGVREPSASSVSPGSEASGPGHADQHMRAGLTLCVLLHNLRNLCALQAVEHLRRVSGCSQLLVEALRVSVVLVCHPLDTAALVVSRDLA